MMASQKFNIHGIETNSNGELTSELTVELINPKSKLTDAGLSRNIGKEIAALLKQSLKDPVDYTRYKVLFVNQINDGEVTKSDYTQQVYKSEELKSNVYIISVGEKFDSSTYLASGKTTFDRNDSVIA